MKRLSLSYNGKKVFYDKYSNGETQIVLPSTIENGRYYTNSIRRENMKWKMTSKSREDFENIWITDDGRISYNSDDKTVSFLENTIHQNARTDDPIYNKAQEFYNILYATVYKIDAFEKASWSPEQVIELRKKQLDTYIRMLGYSDISAIRKRENPTGEFAALSKIGEKLENYMSLDFVRRDISALGNENYLIDIPEFNDEENTADPGDIMEKYSEMIAQAESELIKDDEFISDRMEMLERSRYISKDYFKDMKGKLTKEEWDQYCYTTRSVAKLIMGLNYDLLSEEDREGIKDLTGLSKLERDDKISNLIDNFRIFDKASDIENRYASQECENFEQALDELEGCSDAFKSGELARSLEELRDEAVSTRREKDESKEKYDKMKAFVDKKLIKFVLPKEREE